MLLKFFCDLMHRCVTMAVQPATQHMYKTRDTWQRLSAEAHQLGASKARVATA